MLRSLLESRGQEKGPLRIGVPDSTQIHHRGLPDGERPRLVEDDHPEGADTLQRLTTPDEQPHLRPAAGPDHDRDRGGEAEGAGAGDHQDRDRRDHGRDEAVAGQHPAEEGGESRNQDDGDEDRGHPIRQPLHRRLLRLRSLHQGEDLREHGLRADLGHAQDQRNGPVDGGTDHVVPGVLDHRKALARQHGLVNGTAALDDGPVGRDPLPGSHLDDVPHPEALRRNVDRRRLPPAVGESGPGQQVGGAWLQLGQSLDSVPGPAAGDQLE